MNRTKILWWIIGLLVVLNLSTVATIFYRNGQVQQIQDRTVFIEDGAISLSRQYLCEVLDLCASQKCDFCPLHKAFKADAVRIVTNIDKQKRAMFEEMQHTEPDTNRLNELSESIGELHAKLRKTIAKFYLNVEEICTTLEQKKILKEIFEPLF